jgi:hypothetical protein
VLESEEFGVTISAREYYNSVRKMIPGKEQPQTIDGASYSASGGRVCGKTFPICFSYCPGESAESFAFVWDSLKEE